MEAMTEICDARSSEQVAGNQQDNGGGLHEADADGEGNPAAPGSASDRSVATG
jgi:hypothetical protein